MWLSAKRTLYALYSCLTILCIANGGALGACTFPPDSNSHQIQCETIGFNFCVSTLGYNRTSFPNVFNHTNQAQARAFLSSPEIPILTGLNCSSYAIHFLCAATFPLCVPQQFRKVEPCRELCVSVRESCTAALIDRGLSWPRALDCNRFPLSRSKLCIWGGDCDTNSPTSRDRDTTSTDGDTSSSTNTLLGTCTGHLTFTDNSTQTSFGGIQHCTESCQGVYFERSQLYNVVIWIATWSLLCLLVSCTTCLTYVLDYRKVQPLEIPIGCIAFCYTCMAFIYTLSTALGRQTLICDKEFTNKFNESALIVDGLDSPLCATIFSLLYYFTLCTWTWWGVFTIEWFVCSLRFKNINNIWRLCFHIAAWGLPLVFLVIVLALGYASGDPITQTCWVSKHRELPFLIVPLLTIIVLCSVIIVFSFARVVNLQSNNFSKRNHAQSEDEREIQVCVLRRVGLYCTLYLLPMGILLCTYFYEYWYREQWEMQYLKCQSSSSSTCVRDVEPILAIFFLKIAASLVMGVLSVLWVLRKSSFLAWKRLCCIWQWDKQNSSPNVIVRRFENGTPGQTTTSSSESYSPNVIVSTTSTSRCDNLTTPSGSSTFTESVV